MMRDKTFIVMLEGTVVHRAHFSLYACLNLCCYSLMVHFKLTLEVQKHDVILYSTKCISLCCLRNKFKLAKQIHIYV